MELNTIEKYRVYSEQEKCEPLVAAILVLADSLKEAAWPLSGIAGLVDDTGEVNVRTHAQ